jgi:hypothetical protein|uniref:Uncharacterized protein n=1 Tax=Siphoviridae sp. ctoiW10 TaxID=2827592 RepID=A0A8S5LPE0_9CAUD|nr:MAG TPA: hypothetical protein [Siphoviridae sp. ctoiW10]
MGMITSYFVWHKYHSILSGKSQGGSEAKGDKMYDKRAAIPEQREAGV